MPVYKDNTRGSWFYVLNYKDEYGKRKQKRKRGFKTKKQATEELRKIEAEVIQGTFLEPSTVQLKDYLEKWIDVKRNSISKQTYKMYSTNIEKHIVPFLGEAQLSKLKPLHIEDFINTLIEKDLASSTIRRIFNILNTCLNYAVKVGDLKVNVATKVERPKVQFKEMQIWDIEQVKIFLNATKNHRLYSAFYLAILTGLRQGEILGLRWKDIDFEKRVLHVRQVLEHDGRSIKQGAKTISSIRSVSISPETVNMLKQHMQLINKDKDFYGDLYSNLDLVICTSKGTVMHPRNLLRAFYRFINETNLPRIRFHDLRHTHASIMIAQNEPVKLIAERLGHSKVTTTLDTYGHLLPNMQHEATNRLDKTIFG